ncbi:TonB-dependent receptor [Pseudomaricurvus alkylphenolicus]|uniref:TonB-dependent receptor n=1 Tax=Pseudomaricurvus alkylphenolicus TaxID=1306991 RepID=UPI001422CE8B|nr:TonB-dependent receptor [Pseudomaricurvus alkylphenolicus]NIB38599.1 TonB-dependent receptor [Pseudomaricurvus alkylphenolicus]
MNIIKKSQLAISVAAATAISGLCLVANTHAADDFALEEIVVTAQKRAESVQDIAASISAISGDQLDERGITDTESLMASIPGMHFSQSGANSRITVRGIGTEQTTVTGDPGVAFHIDGVYQARASAGSQLFYDLERVEVLRGPQGTLYGRNATGGSVNLISKRPEDALGGKVELQIGDYNQRRVRGVLNTPLIEDQLLLRISGQRETRDGYYENLTPGADDLEDRDGLNIRTQLLYLPTEDLEILLSVNYSTEKGAGEGNKALGDYPMPTGFNKFMNLYYPTATPNPEDPWEVRTNGIADRDNERKGTSLTLDWNLGAVALKSITAWQENTIDSIADGDFSDADILNENRYQSSKQYSQELQLSSTDAGDWEWVAGLYWLSEESDVDYWLNDQGAGLSSLRHPVFPVHIFPSIDVGLSQPTYFGNASRIESDSIGVFGQASYHLTEDLKLTGGLRYSKDEKYAEISRKEFASPVLETFEKEDSWSSVTWKLGVDWQVAEDNMVYASVSTGFKSGGFLQINNGESYDEEEILAWEVGSKNRFFDNKLQANVSAYYYEYTDMQLRTIRDLASIVTNAGEAEIKGVELELLARPTQNLELNAALAWTSAKFDEYFDDDPLDNIPRSTPLDLAGNDLARSPDFTANLGAAYTWMIPWGTLTTSVNYYWSDEVFFSAYNREDRDFQDSYHKTDVSLTFNSADELWYATLAFQNLENAEVASNINVADASLGGVDRVQWQAPSTYRLSVGYHFQ